MIMGCNYEEIKVIGNNNFGEERDDIYACLSAMYLCFSPMVYTAVLNAAVDLNLFEIIAKASSECGGASASEIASQLKIVKQHVELPHRLDRMLCLLASHALLTCSTRAKEDGEIERVYELSDAGKYFVYDDKNGSLALFSTFMTHRTLLDALLNFKEVLLDCDKGLYKKVHGMPIFEGIQSDPAWNHTFNKAMANICTIEMNKILETYSAFHDGISFLVDVGGGVGQSLNIIISKYPSIKGINFDLPQVIQNAPPLPGIEHVEGDMFVSVPTGDAILLKGILHNWSDENCLKVLRNCYKALPEYGKVIVVDFIVSEEIQSTEADKLVTSFDNLMFLDGGCERTKKEFINLCKLSGFSTFQFVCLAFSALGVMEFHK